MRLSKDSGGFQSFETISLKVFGHGRKKCNSEQENESTKRKAKTNMASTQAHQQLSKQYKIYEKTNQ